MIFSGPKSGRHGQGFLAARKAVSGSAKTRVIFKILHFEACPGRTLRQEDARCAYWRKLSFSKTVTKSVIQKSVPFNLSFWHLFLYIYFELLLIKIVYSAFTASQNRAVKTDRTVFELFFWQFSISIVLCRSFSFRRALPAIKALRECTNKNIQTIK